MSNDRPAGVGRNSARGAARYDMNVRFSRGFGFGGVREGQGGGRGGGGPVVIAGGIGGPGGGPVVGTGSAAVSADPAAVRATSASGSSSTCRASTS